MVSLEFKDEIDSSHCCVVSISASCKQECVMLRDIKPPHTSFCRKGFPCSMLRRCCVLRNLGRGDEYVRRVFDNVSSKYDAMNDVLSLGVHRLWKDHLVEQCIRPRVGGVYLDVAGGTGDIAFRIVDKIRQLGGTTEFAAAAAATPAGTSATASADEAPSPASAASDEKQQHSPILSSVVVLDINAKMLAEGRQRALRDGYGTAVQWQLGSGESLPFPDKSFDSYSIGFGIRNFSDREKGLREAHRVLKVGGVLNILEFSKVTCPLLSLPYGMWSDYVIPVAGDVISGDRESYQYLVDSIKAFPDQETFASMIAASGFGYVRYENLSMGIACIHTAVKIS